MKTIHYNKDDKPLCGRGKLLEGDERCLNDFWIDCKMCLRLLTKDIVVNDVKDLSSNDLIFLNRYAIERRDEKSQKKYCKEVRRRLNNMVGTEAEDRLDELFDD